MGDQPWARQKLMYHVRTFCLSVFWLFSCISGTARAGGGPLGIDHRLNYDNEGIWKRSNQTALMDIMIAWEIGGALWEGGETRLGKTYWQAIDSSALAGVSAAALKVTFTRPRPIQINDPDLWLQGSTYYSFPSGEVSAVTGIVTPFVIEYHRDQPSVYLLEALPLYDGIARMKVQAHWQTDVLAGFALGTLTGYYAHERSNPFILGMLPQGFSVGLSKSW